jgi:hypothetical protein
VALCLGIHYEALQVGYRMVAAARMTHRLRILIGVLIAFTAHSVEALVFAAGWALLVARGYAELSIQDPSFQDVVYFSFSTYTSLGYGDIVPVAHARILAGVESLMGLVLIAWTASYTYLEMRENWSVPDD